MSGEGRKGGHTKESGCCKAAGGEDEKLEANEGEQQRGLETC